MRSVSQKATVVEMSMGKERTPTQFFQIVKKADASVTDFIFEGEIYNETTSLHHKHPTKVHQFPSRFHILFILLLNAFSRIHCHIKMRNIPLVGCNRTNIFAR